MKTILDHKTGTILVLPKFDVFNPLDFLDEFELKQESIKLFGKEVLQPRLSALYGEVGVCYRYSGKTFQAIPWSNWLKELSEKCSAKCGVSFNTALINYYRNGSDSMGLHADDEPELGENPVIASMNYGASRKMVFRKNSEKLKIEVVLNDGDLLIMQGGLQHYWKHELPKQKRVGEPRLNITFRCVKE